MCGCSIIIMYCTENIDTINNSFLPVAVPSIALKVTLTGIAVSPVKDTQTSNDASLS